MNKKVAAMAWFQVTLACTPGADSDPVRDELERSPPAPEVPVPRVECADAIPNMGVALERARATMREAGFSDVSDTSKPGITRGYELTPALPNSWPPLDCKLVFYVYPFVHQIGTSVMHSVEGAQLRIELDLHGGEVSTARISGSLPGNTYDRWSTLSARDQAPMFDAVDRGRIPDLAEFDRYRDWLAIEAPAVVVWLWHRDFFVWMTQESPDLRRSIESLGEASFDSNARAVTTVVQPGPL